MYEFTVEGMTCNNCIRHVTEAVRSVDAGAEVKVDLSTQKITVQSGSNENEFKTALDEAGYPVIRSTKTA